MEKRKALYLAGSGVADVLISLGGMGIAVFFCYDLPGAGSTSGSERHLLARGAG